MLHVPDPEKPLLNKVIASTKVGLKDALKIAQQQKPVLLYTQDADGDTSGTFEMRGLQTRRYFTYFDLVFRNGLNIVPIVGIDFSMANLTMTDASILHTLKPGAQNDYVEALKSIDEAFAHHSSFKMAYGFGARTHVRGEGQDACDLFSLSGNFTQPFFQSKE